MTEHPQKIVALVDGSVYSASVCDHAAWISQRTDAPVELIHVLGRRDAPEAADFSGTIKLGARTALLQELAELDAQRAKLTSHRGRAILEDARAILDKAGVNEITTRLRQGDIVEAVGEIEKDARVIMIGKRGEAADFAKGHLGSNLERIIRASTKPVFVASRAFKPISKVLVAYDGGVSAMKAIDHIARSPLFQGLQVHVVTVGTPTAEVKKGLEDAKALLKAAGLDAETSVIAGQPETALGKLIDEAQIDLLVMGAYGHSRIRTLIIGSTTTAMIRSCKVPVVLTR
ncbi:nucleotide-binding universal stress UspA family protein [Roseinatronobacter thiooxidans]|uniref:Nucleotide-binding universal stress UspA family protein n=1 Tax=Roseinatronobacter thiooxidans TaxID=121821 RepID=A0A2W7QB71_9RHOB|nr:universal stress protein [Roseinatronobacter thiooxidans]PZX45904.1 nucleotide-binding universal stress UspA family protein [Roseinatronobacter thiooxidans]